MRPRARVNLIAGIAGGLWAAAAISLPVQTPLVAASALLAPILAAAIAIVVITRRERRELDVDEAIASGGAIGLIGGFVLAVPFPLAMAVFAGEGTQRQGSRWLPAAGLAMTALASVVLLLAFLMLAVLAAVIAARLFRPRR
jgi:hypothetical protein